MNPATYNITDIWQGATWRKHLVVLSAGVGSEPMDLTGYSASLTIYTNQIAILTLSDTNGGITLGGDTGTMDLYISATDTILVTPGQYELNIVAPDGGDTTALLIGALALAGNTACVTTRGMVGSLSYIGAIARVRNFNLTASLGPTGSTVLMTTKFLLGHLSFLGATSRSTGRSIDGSLAPRGSTAQQTSRELDGSLNPIGATTNTTQRILDAVLSLAGSTNHILVKTFNAILGTAGNLTAAIPLFLVNLSANLGLAGSVGKTRFLEFVAQLMSMGHLGKIKVFIDIVITNMVTGPYVILRSTLETFITNRKFSWGTADQPVAEPSVIADNAGSFKATELDHPVMIVAVATGESNSVEIVESHQKTKLLPDELIIENYKTTDTV